MSADGGWAYAFCAPGGKALAALTLMLNGDDVPEIREHPWLTHLGPGDVLLVGECATADFDALLAEVFAEPPAGDGLPPGWSWWNGLHVGGGGER